MNPERLITVSRPGPFPAGADAGSAGRQRADTNQLITDDVSDDETLCVSSHAHTHAHVRSVVERKLLTDCDQSMSHEGAVYQ